MIVLSPDQPESNARQIAAEFVASYKRDKTYLEGNVHQLVAMAAPGSETELAASRAIFGDIVEPLADCFEPDLVGLYNRFFSDVIQICRKSEPGLDESLKKFGLASAVDILQRATGLRRVGKSAGLSISKPKRVLVLSRVTLGADVAVTSVIIERLKVALPGSEIVLLGGRKASELLGGDESVTFAELQYSRGGTLRERLLSWLDLLDAVTKQTEGFSTSEVLIVDPDSRLTQLGLLPIARPEQYLFFPSREYASDSNLSLGQLASAWSGETFNRQDELLPRVILRDSDREIGRQLQHIVSDGGRRPVATVNFGVGENINKRVGAEFEEAAVGALRQHGFGVIVDRGAGQDEGERIDLLLKKLQGEFTSDLRTLEINEERIAGYQGQADIAVWSGRVGVLAAAIAGSSLYIGYDSAGQHIAAALGIPCIDIFAGYTSPKMLERWKPTGPSKVVVVNAQKQSVDETSRQVRSIISAL